MYNISTKIKSCKHECPFFQSTMDGMNCGHPYWKYKPTYTSMIITHDVDIPSKCPLRNEPLNVRFEVDIGE